MRLVPLSLVLLLGACSLVPPMPTPEAGIPAAYEGAPAGDAFVEVTVEPHPIFSRDGNDVLVELPITLYEAVLGASINVPTIDGKVAVKVPAGSNSGTQLRLRGRGIQAGKNGQRGDQYVRLVVVLPKEVDSDLKAAIERSADQHP